MDISTVNLYRAEKAMSEIEFICDRARIHYLEEKDIEEIAKIIKSYRENYVFKEASS